ncbi:unnamed protein product [Effrenium voratum]|nr:unnamed protein product [Effrenium voratum]
MDEEQFSDDDDQERWDFDDQLVAAAPKEGLPSGDEEDEDTKPEATLWTSQLETGYSLHTEP